MKISWKKQILFGVISLTVSSVCVLLVACGRNIYSAVPTPSLISLTPVFSVSGSGPLLVIINGTGFVGSSSVMFNGAIRPSTMISSQQISVSLTQADLAAPGNYTITVVNPPPGGGIAAGATFSVWDAIEDSTTGLRFAVPPFDTASQVASSPDWAFVEFDLQNSIGQFVPEFSLTIYDNAQGLTLAQWFEQNVDANGILLSSGAYQQETLVDGSSALVFAGPIPDNFFLVGGPPLENVYRVSNSGSILSISQSQVNDLSDYGYSSTQSLIQLESQILGTAHF